MEWYGERFGREGGGRGESKSPDRINHREDILSPIQEAKQSWNSPGESPHLL